MQASGDARPVVVGYDGSTASGRALRWGIDEARMRFVSLIVCHAWHLPYPMPPVSLEAMETVKRMGQHVLDRGVSLARGLAPRLEVREELMTGSPTAALMSESSLAELVAVGQRGVGGFEELQIGSTAIQLASHAHCPVAVVKEPTSPRTDRVVVGVDGANPERAELGVAFEEARLRRASLLAVCLCPAGTDDTRRLAAHFHATVGAWEEKYPMVAVETAVETRPHATVLYQAADRADLVVIGDRGQDDPVELPLGLICQALLRGAPCTVIVVPSRAFSTSSR
ncbi:universal stress protein [Streptosporangium sp. NPDC000396]|uniref:universal stress protein n=1 Tax=Streptosporangium sp. NPDC000396 TaxID=3366185 RepID=UPI0036ABD58E